MGEEENEQKSLIRSNDFEILAVKIREEKEERESFYKKTTLEKQRKSDTLRAIISAYFFLRRELGMSERNLTLEEFKVAETELKKRAQKESKRLKKYFLGFFGSSKAWCFYHKNGYFHYKKTPFGRWYKFHSLANNRPMSEQKIVTHFRREVTEKYPHQNFSTPPNIKQLFCDAYKDKYGEGPKWEDSS